MNPCQSEANICKPLPLVLKKSILEFLGPRDRASLRCASKEWNRAFQESVFSWITTSNPENSLKSYYITFSHIESAIKDRGKEIRALNLKGFEIDTEQLKGVVKNCPNLEAFGCDKISEIRLRYLAELVNLRELNFSGSKEVDGEVLCHLANLINKDGLKISKLNLAGCKKIDAIAFFRITSLVELRELNIIGCKKIDSSSIVCIHDLVGLRKLSFSICQQIDNIFFENIINNLVNLSELNIEVSDDVANLDFINPEFLKDKKINFLLTCEGKVIYNSCEK